MSEETDMSKPNDGQHVPDTDDQKLDNPGVDAKDSDISTGAVNTDLNQLKMENTESKVNSPDNKSPTLEQNEENQNQPTMDSEREQSNVISVTVPKPETCSEGSNEHVMETNQNDETSHVQEEPQNGSDDEYDPDLHISDEERKAFAFMLEKRKEELIKQKEKFQNWVDSITRRRMFALSRIRKINQSHTQRMEFYNKIDNYLTTAETVIRSNAQSSASSSDSNSSQKFEDMVRENTGFMLNTSIGTDAIDNKNGVNTTKTEPTHSIPLSDPKSNNNQVDINSNTQKHDNTNQDELTLNANQKLDSVNEGHTSNGSNNDDKTPKIIPVNS